MTLQNKKKETRSVWFLLIGFCILTVLVFALWRIADHRLPVFVGRQLTMEEQQIVVERNSSLIDYVYLTANMDFPRKERIRKITIHHMAGDLTLEDLGASFAKRDRRASANYAIDSRGRVGLYVEESNRAWTSSSEENDQQAITIEVANDEMGGEWHVSDAAYEKLIDLCVDVCKRNGIDRLDYTGDSRGNLTLHKMFSNRTECPGPYLESKMLEIASRVNEQLAAEPEQKRADKNGLTTK